MTVAAKAQSQLSLPSVTSVEIWPRAVPPVISVGVRTCLLGREVFGGGHNGRTNMQAMARLKKIRRRCRRERLPASAPSRRGSWSIDGGKGRSRERAAAFPAVRARLAPMEEIDAVRTCRHASAAARDHWRRLAVFETQAEQPGSSACLPLSGRDQGDFGTSHACTVRCVCVCGGGEGGKRATVPRPCGGETGVVRRTSARGE